VKVQRKSWIAIGGVLALGAVAVPTSTCSRKRPEPPQPTPLAKAQPSAEAPRPADARPFPDPSFLVLVWIETTPPGAAVRRVSDGHVMGWTPETIEFNQSAEPVLVQIELEGYRPVRRAVSVLEDSQMKVVLEPIPKGRHLATKKAKGSKGQ